MIQTNAGINRDQMDSEDMRADPGSERYSYLPIFSCWTRMPANLASRVERQSKRQRPTKDDSNEHVHQVIPTKYNDDRLG
jgi:hypothetical protein